MSNETSGLLTPKKESKKLHHLYNELMEGKEEPSTALQKKTMFQLLNTKITVLDVKTTRIKFLHYSLRISAMVLSAIATVILGIKFSQENKIWPVVSSNIALGLTTAVTFLTGLSVFWDTENYWKRNKVMLNKLKELRYEYSFIISGSDMQKDALKTILDKYLDALGDEYWEKLLKNASNKSDKQ
jgi:hypothetical protein